MISLAFKKNNVVNIEPNSIHYTKNDNQYFMTLAHIGFKNLEERHAEIVSQNGGHILEVGFGLHCSADKFIDSNIASYTCIEINDTIYQQALNWAQGKQNVTIINGAWENIIPTLTTQYDGIYYSPLDVDYIAFMNACKSISKVGTIMSVQGINTMGMDVMQLNVDSNVAPPHLFDNVFTQNLYNALYDKYYFKVYWQYFDGTNYVKTLP